MSTIGERVSQIQTNITNALSALSGYGISITGKKSDDLADLINQIPKYESAEEKSF